MKPHTTWGTTLLEAQKYEVSIDPSTVGFESVVLANTATNWRVSNLVFLVSSYILVLRVRKIKSQKLEFQLKPCFTVSAQYRHCVHKIKKKATFCTEQRSRGPMVWWYIAAMHCRLHTGKAAAVCKIIKKVRFCRLSCKMYCRLLQRAAFFFRTPHSVETLEKPILCRYKEPITVCSDGCLRVIAEIIKNSC